MSNESSALIARGQRAEALLATDMFQLATRDVEAGIVNDMLVTEPHEAKKREGLYQKHQGLMDIVGTLKSYIETGLAEQERSENAED